MIDVEQVDHVGIRVMDAARAIEFYGHFGFEVILASDLDAVFVLKNSQDVEINLIVNGNDANDGRNILMDVDTRFPGFTHVALRVASVRGTIEELQKRHIPITQGPVTFGDGHVSVFVRDPDRNVIELRGRLQDLSELDGVTVYEP